MVLGDVDPDPQALVERVADMLQHYVEQAQARKLIFSPKSTIVGTTLGLARRVEQSLRRRGVLEFVAKTSVRDVGLDFGGGRRRTVLVRNARLAKAGGRMKQIAILSRASFVSRKLATSGAVPVALYGEEAMGLPSSFLLSLQSQMVVAAGMDPRAGCSAAMFEVAYGRRKDPWNVYLRDLLPAFFDVFRRSEGPARSGIVRTWALAARDVRSEAAAASSSSDPSASHPFAGATTGKVEGGCSFSGSTRWRKVSGTIGAVVNSLADLG